MFITCDIALSFRVLRDRHPSIQGNFAQKPLLVSNNQIEVMKLAAELAVGRANSKSHPPRN